MKSSIFNLLIAGNWSALATLLFNGRNIGIYHALRDSELPGSLSEAAAQECGAPEDPPGRATAGPSGQGLPIPNPLGPFWQVGVGGPS